MPITSYISTWGGRDVEYLPILKRKNSIVINTGVPNTGYSKTIKSLKDYDTRKNNDILKKYTGNTPFYLRRPTYLTNNSEKLYYLPPYYDYTNNRKYNMSSLVSDSHDIQNEGFKSKRFVTKKEDIPYDSVRSYSATKKSPYPIGGIVTTDENGNLVTRRPGSTYIPSIDKNKNNSRRLIVNTPKYHWVKGFRNRVLGLGLENRDDVIAMLKKLGVKADGIWGKNTENAYKSKFGFTVDSLTPVNINDEAEELNRKAKPIGNWEGASFAKQGIKLIPRKNILNNPFRVRLSRTCELR